MLTSHKVSSFQIKYIIVYDCPACDVSVLSKTVSFRLNYLSCVGRVWWLVHCQPVRIDSLLGMPGTDYLGYIRWYWQTHLNSGRDQSMDRTLWDGGSRLSTANLHLSIALCFLIVNIRGKQPLRFLLPWLPLMKDRTLKCEPNHPLFLKWVLSCWFIPQQAEKLRWQRLHKKKKKKKKKKRKKNNKKGKWRANKKKKGKNKNKTPLTYCPC